MTASTTLPLTLVLLFVSLAIAAATAAVVHIDRLFQGLNIPLKSDF